MVTTGGWRRVAVLAVLALLAGCGATPAVDRAAPAPAVETTSEPPTVTREQGIARSGVPAPTPSPETRARAADHEPVQRFRSVRGLAEAPLPSSLRVPALGVDSSLLTLGRQADGTVEVPADWHRAGWFTEGARPGEPGPAVILGHVDSRAGPAVFYRLHELRPGDELLVDRVDGSTVRFTVDRVERHDKDDFPTRSVYYPTLEPTLRLVTCGGAFDPQQRSYRDNVIVFATRAP